jgi:hypothetical protein
VNAAPNLETHAALMIVALLSVATVGMLPAIWRGPWQPDAPEFINRLTATIVITLLVAYHSQPHGAALLIVPAGLAVARSASPPGVRTLLIGSVALAPLLGIISVFVRADLSLVSIGITMTLAALLVLLVRAELTRDSPGPWRLQSASLILSRSDANPP